MTKAASSLALRAPRTLRLLPVLLLLAALLATVQLLVSDPDAGSGIGGTGRFGGESGLGGTGGPVNSGPVNLGPINLGLDARDDAAEDEQAERVSLDAGALIVLASTQVEVERLRTEPEALPPSSVAVAPQPAAVDLLSPAALRAQALSEPALTVAATPAPSQLPPSPLHDFAPLRAEAAEASAARAAADLQAATTQQLLLAEAVTQLDLPAANQPPLAIDVRAERHDERLRLSRPARPEVPERPSLQAPRVPVPPRGIPTPPVRPMRL